MRIHCVDCGGTHEVDSAALYFRSFPKCPGKPVATRDDLVKVLLQIRDEMQTIDSLENYGGKKKLVQRTLRRIKALEF